MDSCAELPIEDAVDVERGELRIVGQQLVDGFWPKGDCPWRTDAAA